MALEIANDATILGMDLLAVEPINGATVLQGDFTDPSAPAKLMTLMQTKMATARENPNGVKVDLVLSDMAAATTGHNKTDHLRIIALAEMAYDFACQTLRKDGAFVTKVFSGGAENSLMVALKRDFSKVSHFNPPASRRDSAEMYVIAMGYRGTTENADHAENADNHR